METLSQYTARELEMAIKGIQATYEWNDSIDERFELEWKVLKMDTKFFISAHWFSGEVQDYSYSPLESNDSNKVISDWHFHLVEGQSFRKFTKEVLDAISQVVDKEYDDCVTA